MENKINGYVNNDRYIHLPVDVDASSLPKEILLDSDTLLLKTEFHVSLVCVTELAEALSQDAEQKIVHIFNSFVEKNDVAFKGFAGELRVAEKIGEERRKTLVAMCIVSNIEELYNELNKQLGSNFDIQPTHITLYTLGLDRGIGLNSSEDIANMTKDITEDICSKYPSLERFNVL